MCFFFFFQERAESPIIVAGKWCHISQTRHFQWNPHNTYRKVWLISACAYHSQCKEIMRLLDDVRLIGSKILAPPTTGMFKRSSTKPASYELGDSWEQLCYSSWKYNWKPSMAENHGKIAVFFASKSWSRVRPVSIENVTVLSIATLVQLAIWK